jgi:hypothetical protein
VRPFRSFRSGDITEGILARFRVSGSAWYPHPGAEKPCQDGEYPGFFGNVTTRILPGAVIRINTVRE